MIIHYFPYNHGSFAMRGLIVKSVYVFVMVLFVCSCSWVKPEYGAEKVALVKLAHIQNCKKVGTVYSNTTNRILGIHRSHKKVNDELLTLAKNEALELGGDTLVALGPVVEGEQKFDAYRCIK